MRAKIETQSGISIVYLEGFIDVGTSEMFRAAWKKSFSGKRVVLDFSRLQFVGSSGILPFVSVLEEVAQTSGPYLKLSGIGIDFQRVLSSSRLAGREAYISAGHAIRAFDYQLAANT